MSHYEPQFPDNHDMSLYVTVNGGWGTLYCDAETGEVVHYDRYGDWENPGDGYDNILRVDVDEWRAYWPGGDLTAGHDILDFGTWDRDGCYVGPEMDWREELIRDRPELAAERQAGGSSVK